MTPRLTIFSVIDNQKYEKYVIPFIFMPLLLNDDVSVEVHLKTNYDDWVTRNADALEMMEMWFPNRFLVKPLESEFWHVLPCGSTARFYTEPLTEAKWVKISDIDILHIDPNLVRHFDRLQESTSILEKHPYLGLKRLGENKLSGTYTVLRHHFYTDKWREHRNEYMSRLQMEKAYELNIPPFDQPHYYHDEFVNWNLVIPVHGQPSEEMARHPEIYRPIQGIHVSPNRPTYAPPWQPEFPDWGITQERKKVWEEITQDSKYQIISKHFTEEMKELLDKI